jgi:predicted dehydrogenase
MQQVAFVGCSHIHTPNFAKMINLRSDVHVKYVWDPDPALANRYAVDLHSQPTGDLSSIWSDPTVSGVIICSQTKLHQHLVSLAAQSQKHMFVEKPLGYGKTDSAVMLDEIKKAGVIFQTGYFMRGRDTNLKIKQLIEQGAFGKITRLRLSNCHAGGLAGWFVNKEWSWMTDISEAGVGGFGDLGTHILDIAFYLLQSPARRVTSTIKVVTGVFGDCDESGEGLMELENGVTVSLAAGWVDIANPVSLVLSGLEGHALVMDGKMYLKSKHIDGADGINPITDLPAPWPHAFEIYLNALTGQNVPSLVSPDEAYRNSVVMEAFYQASKDQTWVNL